MLRHFRSPLTIDHRITVVLVYTMKTWRSHNIPSPARVIFFKTYFNGKKQQTRKKGYTTRKTWRCRYLEPRNRLLQSCTTTTIPWTLGTLSWRKHLPPYIYYYTYSSGENSGLPIILNGGTLLRSENNYCSNVDETTTGVIFENISFEDVLVRASSISFTRPQNGRQLEWLSITDCRGRTQEILHAASSLNYLRRYISSVANDLRSTNFGQ
jgi:hypothetical protein